MAYGLRWLVLMAVSAPAWGGLAECRALTDDAARLACYDALAAETPGKGAETPAEGAEMPAEGAAAVVPAIASPAAVHATDLPEEEPPLPPELIEQRRARGTTLADRWELDKGHRRGIFVLRPYKPMYILPAHFSSHVNEQPFSPAPGHGVPEVAEQRDGEVKFQLSFKAKVWDNLLGDNGDLWFGYTQQSHWQLYNSKRSAPFRETNHEPELMMVFRTNYQVAGLDGRMIAVGLNHQSNGRSLPLSRSWNRVFVQFAMERGGDFIALLRPWWRVHEDGNKDDNPDISNYVGRADLLLVKKFDTHQVSALLRHTLRTGENNRGALQLDWSFPLTGYLKGHVQLFTGYGESLIDYNHRQTSVGFGISLLQWL